MKAVITEPPPEDSHFIRQAIGLVKGILECAGALSGMLVRLAEHPEKLCRVRLIDLRGALHAKGGVCLKSDAPEGISRAKRRRIKSSELLQILG